MTIWVMVSWKSGMNEWHKTWQLGFLVSQHVTGKGLYDGGTCCKRLMQNRVKVARGQGRAGWQQGKEGGAGSGKMMQG